MRLCVPATEFLREGVTMSAPMDYTRQDFDHSPMVVFYEVTRACDLLCKHCRASAQPHCDPRELSGRTAKALIDDLTKFPKPPLLVLTGGDPIKRPDVFELVEYATARGLVVAMTPSATPLVTADAVPPARVGAAPPGGEPGRVRRRDARRVPRRRGELRADDVDRGRGAPGGV